MGIKSIILTATCAAVVRAHGLVSGFITDGTWNQGFILDYYYQLVNGGTLPDIGAWYAENLDNGFIEPYKYNTSDINCHKNARPGSRTISVKAGGIIEFQWTLWPHDIGPVLTYVADCRGDCSAVDRTTLLWVKIDEEGWDASTKLWASGKLIANNSTWTTTIPSTLAPGNYVFRHEIIALHGGSSLDGAQNYPQCFNIAITGSGTDKPAGTLGVNLYKPNDAGILFNPYINFSTYTIPGPSLYRPGSGSVSSSTTATATPTTTATTLATTTTTKVSTTTTTATKTNTTTTASPTSTGIGAPLYGQCGGIGWSGTTTCAQGQFPGVFCSPFGMSESHKLPQRAIVAPDTPASSRNLKQFLP
ncbi:glycosyl hydrolase family 61-domain-containing protein [Nemania abortiva]|nr:glycosyl hydrolase family 61-domain-containing protein [Nemania abortiva]